MFIQSVGAYLQFPFKILGQHIKDIYVHIAINIELITLPLLDRIIIISLVLYMNCITSG